MAIRMLVASVLIASLTSCGPSAALVDPDSAPYESPKPADYTVVAKNVYRGEGKTGYYVTLVLFGAERETAVSERCYSVASIGKLLPETVSWPSQRPATPTPSTPVPTETPPGVTKGPYSAAEWDELVRKSYGMEGGTEKCR